MFAGASVYNQPMLSWNVGNVVSMAYMFCYAGRFNQPLDNWDVSQVTYMDHMFEHAKVFNQSLNKWNVQSLEKVENMFAFAYQFDSCHIAKWGDRVDKANMKLPTFTDRWTEKISSFFLR